MAIEDYYYNDAEIVSGPSLRELELALTDPRPIPTGNLRAVRFNIKKSKRRALQLVAQHIMGLRRSKSDPAGDSNSFIWTVSGKGSLNLEIVNFEAIYSPITRKGNIKFL